MKLRSVNWLGLCASVVVLGALAAPAQATPFSSALVFTYDPIYTGAVNDAHNGGSTSSASLGHSGPGFSDSTYAEANLSTATLKSKGSINVSNPAINPYVQSNATFSDGFTTTTLSGQPFHWDTTTSATFNLNFGTNNILYNGGNNNASAFVILGINKRGKTDANSNWFTSSDTLEYFLYQFGPNTPTIHYTYNGDSVDLVTNQYFASVPTNISASFEPGGDFDWVLLFGLSGQQFDVGGFNYDLSHTLTLDYVAPPDTITTSDSGVFGTLAAVPEPMTLSLFGAGLAGVFAARRRKSKAA